VDFRGPTKGGEERKRGKKKERKVKEERGREGKEGWLTPPCSKS